MHSMCEIMFVIGMTVILIDVFIAAPIMIGLAVSRELFGIITQSVAGFGAILIIISVCAYMIYTRHADDVELV